MKTTNAVKYFTIGALTFLLTLLLSVLSPVLYLLFFILTILSIVIHSSDFIFNKVLIFINSLFTPVHYHRNVK